MCSAHITMPPSTCTHCELTAYDPLQTCSSSSNSHGSNITASQQFYKPAELGQSCTKPLDR